MLNHSVFTSELSQLGLLCRVMKLCGVSFQPEKKLETANLLIRERMSETVNHKHSAEGITFMGPDPNHPRFGMSRAAIETFVWWRTSSKPAHNLIACPF